MNVALGVLTQNASSDDVGMFTHPAQTTPCERMERVGDPHKLLVGDRNGRS
ncbi:MAG: hypothetical protein Q8P41_26690 [Pseudomonadota bacterium]|nr:hypothetical protein [Pseudomonadota bacterium]